MKFSMLVSTVLSITVFTSLPLPAEAQAPPVGTGAYGRCSECGQNVIMATHNCGPARSSHGGSGPGSWQLNAARDLGSAAGSALADFLFGKPKRSGPSAEELREEQIRQAQIAEAQRLEAERLEAERQRRENLHRAARWRERIDKSEAEMTQSLEGAFEVFRARNSTAFFGTEGNPDEPDIRAELADVYTNIQADNLVVDNAQMIFQASQQAQHENEAHLRGDAVWGNSSVVDFRLGSDMATRINSYLLDDAIRIDDDTLRQGVVIPNASSVERARVTEIYWRTGEMKDARDLPPHSVGWPKNPNPLYNPLREPDRAAADFALDSMRVEKYSVYERNYNAQVGSLRKYTWNPEYTNSVRDTMERRFADVYFERYKEYLKINKVPANILMKNLPPDTELYRWAAQGMP